MGFLKKVGGGISGLIGGTDSKYKADPSAKYYNEAAANGANLSNEGVKDLNTLYQQDPTQLIQNRISNENRLMREASADAGRRTNQLLAARGLQGSSIGIGQANNVAQDLSNNIAANNASQLGREYDLRQNIAQNKLATGNSLLGLRAQAQQAGIQMNPYKIKKGGLLGQGGVLDTAAPFAGAAAAAIAKGG
jgi:hypothetical protein